MSPAITLLYGTTWHYVDSDHNTDTSKGGNADNSRNETEDLELRDPAHTFQYAQDPSPTSAFRPVDSTGVRPHERFSYAVL